MADKQNHGGVIIFRTQAEHEQRVADMLDDARIRFEAGDAWSLARAIAICGQYKVVMPRWVSSAYIKKFEAVHFGQERVLTLGSPYRKDAKITAVARQMNEGWEVYRAVTEYLQTHPLDGLADAYIEVSRALNARGVKTGKGAVAKYYKDALQAIEEQRENILKKL